MSDDSLVVGSLDVQGALSLQGNISTLGNLTVGGTLDVFGLATLADGVQSGGDIKISAGGLSADDAITTGTGFDCSATTNQFVTSFGSSFPTTISIPTMIQTATLTVPDVMEPTAQFIMSDGDSHIFQRIGQSITVGDSTSIGTAIQALTGGIRGLTFGAIATTNQIFTSSGATNFTTINIPTMGQPTVCTVPDVGVTATNFLMSNSTSAQVIATGDVELTNGNVQLDAGDITLTAGSIALPAGTVDCLNVLTEAGTNQLRFNSGGTLRQLSFPITGIPETITIPDCGNPTAFIPLAPVSLTPAGSIVVVGAVTNTVSSTTSPTVSALTFSTNPTSSLSAYTTGSFTPTIRFGISGTPITGLAVDIGTYTRIGNLVTFWISITIGGTIGSFTGSGLVGALPYAATSANVWTCPMVYAAVSFSATYVLAIASIQGGGTDISLLQMNNTDTPPGTGNLIAALSNININPGTALQITGSYVTNASP